MATAQDRLGRLQRLINPDQPETAEERLRRLYRATGASRIEGQMTGATDIGAGVALVPPRPRPETPEAVPAGPPPPPPDVGPVPVDAAIPFRRDPRPLAERSVAAELAAAGLRGVGRFTAGAGGVAQALTSTPAAPMPGQDIATPVQPRGQAGRGLERVGEALATTPGLRRSAEAEAGGVFDPTNIRWWAAGLGEQLPQIAIQLGAAVLTSGASVPAQFAAFAAPVAVGEGGSAVLETRDALLAQGASEEEAMQGAAGAGFLTAAGSVALEQLPFAAIVLKRVPGAREIFQNAVAKRLLQVGAAAGAEGITEAAQEAWADVMQYVQTNDPETFAELGPRMAGAGSLAAVLGGGTALATGTDPIRSEPAAEPAVDERVETVAQRLLGEQREREATEALVPGGMTAEGRLAALQEGIGRAGPLPPVERDPLETPTYLRRGARVEEVEAARDALRRATLEEGRVRPVRPRPLAPPEGPFPKPPLTPQEAVDAPPPPDVDVEATEAPDVPEAPVEPAAPRPFERLSDDELRTRYLRNARLAFATGAEGMVGEQEMSGEAFRQRTSKKAQFVGRGRSRGMTTQAENRTRAYEEELKARGVDVPHPDEAFLDVDPETLPASVQRSYERAVENLPDLSGLMNESLMRLLDTVEQNALKRRSDPVAQIERAIVSGEAHRRGVFDVEPEFARQPGDVFEPGARTEATDDFDEMSDEEIAVIARQKRLPAGAPRSVVIRELRRDLAAAEEGAGDQGLARARERLTGQMERVASAGQKSPRDIIDLSPRHARRLMEALPKGTALRLYVENAIEDAAGGAFVTLRRNRAERILAQTESSDVLAEPAEAQDDLFGGSEIVAGSEQRDLELGEAPRTLERQERLARQTVDRLRPKIEANAATEAETEAYREALALTRRGQGQSAEEVRLRAREQEPESTGEGEAPEGDLFADPGGVPAQSPARTDPASADPYLTEEGARAIGDRMAGNLETPAGFRGRPTAAPEIIKALEAVTEAAGKKIRVREGRAGSRGVPGFASGAFFPRSEVQRVRQANNIPTATHETAHVLEQLVFGRVKGSPWTSEGPAGVNTAIQNELARLGKELYGDRKPNGGYKREGWAEFVRMWVTETDLKGRPVDLAVKVPALNRWFDETFSREHPGIRKALQAARDKTTRFREQGSVQRARAGIVDTMAPGAQARRAAKGVGEFFSMENWVEMALPLAELSKAVQRETGKALSPTEDPYVTISALRTTHDARVRYMVEEGMIDLNGNRVGDPLSAIRNIVKGKKDDFMIYLWARRTIAEKERGKGRETGLSIQDARQIVTELETPGFELAAQKVYEWNDGVLNYAAQASPTFRAVVDQVREKDPGDYIPLQREFEELDRAWSRSGAAGSRSPVKRFKGSGRRVKDPFQAMIAKASSTVMQAHKRRVLDQMIRLADVPGVGDLIVEVPQDQRPAYAASVGRLVGEIERVTGQKVEFQGEEDMGALETAELLGHLVTFFSPVDVPTQQEGTNPILPIYEEGKVRWFEVDRGLYDTLASIEIYRLPKVLDMTLGVSARTFRAGTTGLRASFGLIVNPLRDVQTMYVNTQSSAAAPRLLFEWLRSMGEVSLWRTTGKRTEWVDAFVRLGMEMSQPLGQDIRHTRRAARRVFEGRTVRTLDPRNWYDWFRDLMQTPESAPRIAELRLIAREIGWEPGQPMSNAQALQLMRAASEVTTDFKAAGRLSRIVNQTVSFHNAGIQGPRAHVRALKRNPAKFVGRGLQLTVASLLLWWLNKDEEWWTQMDAREKYLYTHIPFDHPVTGTPELLRMPRAFEVGGVFMALPEFLADAAYRQDPALMKAWAESFVESSAPPLFGFTNVDGVPVPYLENPAVETFSEQLANRRFYFDTPIVPRGEQEMPPEEQFNEYTTKVSIVLGDLFNASPRRIDHAMQGLFGPVSRDLTEVLGLGPADVDREKELADLPVVGRLFQRGGRFGTRPKAVNEVYDAAAAAVRKQHSERDPETEDERQLRLQLQDATKAITALSFVRQYTPGLEQRKALTRTMAALATDALEAHRSGAVDRPRFAAERKGAQTLKEQVKERRERLAAERELEESRKDVRASPRGQFQAPAQQPGSGPGAVRQSLVDSLTAAVGPARIQMDTVGDLGGLAWVNASDPRVVNLTRELIEEHGAILDQVVTHEFGHVADFTETVPDNVRAEVERAWTGRMGVDEDTDPFLSQTYGGQGIGMTEKFAESFKAAFYALRESHNRPEAGPKIIEVVDAAVPGTAAMAEWMAKTPTFPTHPLRGQRRAFAARRGDDRARRIEEIEHGLQEFERFLGENVRTDTSVYGREYRRMKAELEQLRGQ